MPSMRRFLTASETEWSLHTFCVAMVSVRSMSSTETCHIASRKTGRLSWLGLGVGLESAPRSRVRVYPYPYPYP